MRAYNACLVPKTVMLVVDKTVKFGLNGKNAGPRKLYEPDNVGDYSGCPKHDYLHGLDMPQADTRSKFHKN